jgi:hypothetical protein
MEDNHSEKIRKDFFSQDKMNKDLHSLEMEVNRKISEITTEINDNYPELIKYLDETPLTISHQDDPGNTIHNLQSYYESLVSILENYKSKHPE